MSFLKIENLHISLGEFSLNGMSLELEKGSYLTIIGPTGAGKTILLECLIGFYEPDMGQIFLEGNDITRELPENREIGIVYQDYALLPHFTVYKNISYGLKKKDKNFDPQKIHEMAETLNISHLLKRTPTTLSGGEQQRVALARALVVEPKLLLMDEPLSALDPQTTIETRRLLKKVIGKCNTTVIHITHDLDDSWALADTVAVFRQGRIIQFGSVRDVFNRPANPFIADFVGASILDGEVTSLEGQEILVGINGMCLSSVDRANIGESVRVAIRPEDILVSKSKPEYICSCNVIEARLENIVSDGRTCSVTLCSGRTRFCAMLTNTVVQHLMLSRGDTVYAMIKSADVRIC